MSGHPPDRQQPEVPSPFEVPEVETIAAVEPVGQEPSDVGRRATSGVIWLTAQRWVTRLFGFFTIALLTRLLGPADFGTVAAASTVLPFFFLLADLGFAAYIVQVDRTNDRLLSTAFWFSISAGVVLCAIMFVLAPVLGLAFADPKVVPVIQALSLWVVLTAFGSVPLSILRREMRFGVIAGQSATAALIAQAVAVVMALAGFGVWALVAQSLVAPLVTTVLSWITVRWHPRRLMSFSDLKAMARFGTQVLGVEFVAMLRVAAEAAVTSNVLGVAALGYMNVAQRLVQVVQDLTGSAIVPVTNVAFARVRESTDRLRSAYLRALKLTYAALSLPLTFVAVSAPQLVPILFGSGWAQSSRVAQILAIAGVLSVGAWLDHGLYYGLGKPGVWLVYALIIDALTLGATIFTVRWGLEAIAWGFLVVAVVATVVRWFMVAREIRSPLRVVTGPFGYLLIAVGVSGALGWGVSILTASWPGPLTVLAVGFTVTVAHLGITLLRARDVVDDLVALVARSKLGTRLPFAKWASSHAERNGS